MSEPKMNGLSQEAAPLPTPGSTGSQNGSSVEGRRAPVRFVCYVYPELKVLVARGNDDDSEWHALGGDKMAAFHSGSFETDDPQTIAVLDRAAYVYRSDEIDVEVVPITTVGDYAANAVTPRAFRRKARG